MSDRIPADVQEFIFEYIDSIEQLDSLLLLREHRDRSWTPEQVSRELRTNPGSAALRLAELARVGVLKAEGDEPPAYRYDPPPAMDAVVGHLAEVCKVRRHHVYELIFSSLKKARRFLEAFTVTGKKGNPDG